MTLEDLSRIHPIIEEPAGHIGRGTPGRHDEAALRGSRRYVADIVLPGMLEVVIVRSPYPHATIASIDTAAAEALDGVVAVYTGADLSDVAVFPDLVAGNNPTRQRALMVDRVRYVGSPYAAVVAVDRYVGEDAAALIIAGTEFAALPTVMTIDEALADDAPLLFADWPGNKVFDVIGNEPAVRKAFDEADHTFTEVYSSQRYNGMPMETRGVVAEFTDGAIKMWTSAQSPHLLRTTVAGMLGIPESKLRVIVPAVGGGFGTKTHNYPEDVVVPWIARKLGTPVRWVEDRAEHLVASAHAREQRHLAEVAYDDDGTIRGIRYQIVGDVGSGEINMPGTAPTFVTSGCITGGYDLPNVEIDVACVVTNKTPSGAYRGFGIPEAVFCVERVIDRVAQLTETDRVEIRRRLILQEDQLPYKMPRGGRIDSGSHAKSFERAVEMLEPAAAEIRARYGDDPDVRVGVGYANYVEPTAPTYMFTSGNWAGYDSATVQIEPDGSVRVGFGVVELGQGIMTTAASTVAEMLGVEPDNVTVVLGDTDRSPYGIGSWGSRGAIVMTGSALMACNRLLDKGAAIAAHMLEGLSDDTVIASEDVVLSKGRFHVAGQAEPSVGWDQIATAAWARTLDLPDGMEPGLLESCSYDPPDLEHALDEEFKINAAASWGNGTHAGVVSVRLSTGEVRIEDYVAVHDCGVELNPTMVEGQVLGSIAQGIGGALYEDMKYDATTGQPRFASFMEYMIPTCSEIPTIRLDHFETFAPNMPLGVKGCAEGGTIGPPAVLAGAVSDALAEFGVDFTATPVTPDAVRLALREAHSTGGAQ